MHAPHRHIAAQNAAESFLISIFDSMWERYRSRVEHVRRYEEMIDKHGARFLNDHIAFRALALQSPPAGIFSVSRVFEALGYVPAACYEFPDKKLSSIHYRPPNPQLPKLFVSQLKTWELSPQGRRIVEKSLKTHRPAPSDAALAELGRLEKLSTAAKKSLSTEILDFFARLPWELPEKADVEALEKESQFGAWVLVNGYDVNHFTASVDSHGVSALSDIEKTVAAMKAAGIPMKAEIEGARGTKLRQSSTQAVVRDVAVRVDGKKAAMPWTYAYFEIAERPALKSPETGKLERFEGFLGGQATQLFEMTKRG
jgi:hypothetical protein